MSKHFLKLSLILGALVSILIFTQSDVFGSALESNCFFGILLESALIIASSYFLPRKWRIIFIPFLLVISFQFVNFISTAQYIEPLTFQNLRSFRSIGTKQIFLLSVFFLSWSLFTVSICFLKEKRTKWGGVAILLLAVFLWKGSTLSPIYNFYLSLKRAYIESTFSSKSTKNLNKSDFINTFKLSSAPYLFKGDNVLLLFLEGFSDEIINEKLTPNLFNLEKKSLSVKNYYSHTAATFRGIRGQLVSGYQLAQGYTDDGNGLGQIDGNEIKKKFKNKPVSITDIFSTLNYSTIFVSPHSNKEQLLQTMLTTGFKKGKGYEDYGYHSDMSDKQAFKALIDELKKLDDSKPFFISTYFFGTHHGQDSPDVKFRDGENPYFNKFHNLDFWLGIFLEEFNKLPLSKNTVIVITADHSTYPTPQFNKSFKLNKKCFIGKIPLIIYKKGLKPLIFDAGYCNSLSLAPTLLDLFGIDNINTYFLGKSIFVKNKGEYSRISAIGSQFYSINPQKIEDASSPKNSNRIKEKDDEEVKTLKQDEIPNSIKNKIYRFYKIFG